MRTLLLLVLLAAPFIGLAAVIMLLTIVLGRTTKSK
jgi:hypothetical protein